MLSIPHMLVVFVIVLVVFGPQKLPELARSLGKMLAEFRKASTDFKSAFEEEMKDLERQAREVERKKAAEAAANAANEAPVQAATFATAAGTETPAIEARDGAAVSGEARGSGEVEAVNHATADAFGEPLDARVTEGTAELVVTPVAEAVARAGSLDFEAHANKTSETSEARVPSGGVGATEADGASSNGDGSSSNANVKSDEGAASGVDLPHDQQPA